MSATHSRFGLSAVKLRSTRSGVAVEAAVGLEPFEMLLVGEPAAEV
jgi:hypothetical protein